MTAEYRTDILAFGAHADDVEIGMGGTIAKLAARGKKVVICDLTKASYSSNGTVSLRMEEAKNAANILGVTERRTLDLPDRGLYMKEENIEKIVAIIRAYAPKLVFAPFAVDRHPDHGNASRLVREATFSAGIHKFMAETQDSAHRPKALHYYMINGFHQPDFFVEIDKFMEKKICSLKAYESQFTRGDNGVETPLTNGYIDGVMARERVFGKETGFLYAEGFKTEKAIVLDQDLLGE
ncbi:bacillithiol biosynthesis deacetylase BshB1 [Bacillus sp. 2205SS5-2]|uniref:bacillithiol biosynthesis deacetylase BshB1 n=1 Tax=Bacillus sp. 2205SS5-2 TaxID=3109031 RepID=UPI00300585C0